MTTDRDLMVAGPGRDRRQLKCMLEQSECRTILLTRRLSITDDAIQLLNECNAAKVSIVVNHLNEGKHKDTLSAYPHIEVHFTSDLIGSSCYLTESQVMISTGDILTNARRTPFRISTRIPLEGQYEAYNRASNMIYAAYEYARNPELFITPGQSRAPDSYVSLADLAKQLQTENANVVDQLKACGLLYYDGIKTVLTEEARSAGAYQVFRRRRQETFWPKALVQSLSNAA